MSFKSFRSSALLLGLLCAVTLRAADDDLRATMLQLAARNPKPAIEKLAQSGDARLLAFFENYNKDNVYNWKGTIVIVPELKEIKGEKTGQLYDSLSGEALRDERGAELIVPASALEEVSPGRQRNFVKEMLTTLRLADP